MSSSASVAPITTWTPRWRSTPRCGPSSPTGSSICIKSSISCESPCIVRSTSSTSTSRCSRASKGAAAVCHLGPADRLQIRGVLGQGLHLDIRHCLNSGADIEDRGGDYEQASVEPYYSYSIFLVRFAKATSLSDSKMDKEMENMLFFYAKMALI